MALVLLVGNAPGWVIPLVVGPAGITYPLSFGGFTSMIPAIAPGELLPPANCWASPPRVCARSCRCHSYAA